ncbi:MAG TPA: BamA/TamA family outer membrane protein [Firmicutes bacterium]|jgi:outer membrane protein insertion porin family|nr:BamA/TamA family outer membrane protein [Bacillota bacterium]
MRQRSARLVIALLVLGLLASVGSSAVQAQGQELGVVRLITIEGNNFVDTETIRASILKTRLGEEATEQKIIDDIRAIYDLGYFEDVQATVDPALGGVEVVFHVVENPIVREVTFSGVPGIAFEKYARDMKTQPGLILNAHDIWEDLEGLWEWVLGEYGYLVRVTSLSADTDGRIGIELAQTTLQDIVITGNEKTKDFVIERELTFEAGDPVDIKAIDQSLRRLLMLGYFDEISREFSQEDDPDKTVLTINLKERKTGAATFGVGYSTAEGLVGFLQVSDDNFLGRGQMVKANVSLGQKVTSYEFEFYEPYITKSGISLGTSLYRRISEVKTADPDSDEETKSKRTSIGGDLTLGKPLTEFTRGRLTFKLENNTYAHEDGPIGGVPDDSKTRNIGVGLNTNTVDHPFFPTEGYKNDVYLELGTTLFGGTSAYAKLSLEHSRFFEVKDGGYVLALRGMGGRLLGGSLPEADKFRIGGADTLRGYSYGDSSLGLVGDNMLVMNAEFRFPIVEKVQGVVFTDWGTTWNQGQSFNMKDLKNSFGIGVRLDTPLGLLRLDYGLGKDAENHRKGQFYFGIGQAF